MVKGATASWEELSFEEKKRLYKRNLKKKQKKELERLVPETVASCTRSKYFGLFFK